MPRPTANPRSPISSNPSSMIGARPGTRSARPSRGTAKRPMPMIEPARPGTPLTQGDILSGVALFATKSSQKEKGGEAAVTKSDLCLVLSRPCAAAHKKHVVVAGIAKYPDAVPKGLDTFDKVLDFLTG